jgi:hypothetical protein
VTERQDIYRKVEAAGLKEAVVFVATDGGLARPIQRGDLLCNGLKIGDESITYAHDRGPLNEELGTLFSDCLFYIYNCGSLVPLQAKPLFTTEVFCTHIAGPAPRDQQGTSR